MFPSHQRKGSFAAPDVNFFDRGVVNFKVAAENIPDGTLVSLRIDSSGQIVSTPDVALAGGEAIFSVAVPEGTGSIQATASFAP